MTTAILADLDDTLFDDRHAMSCAISALHLSHGVGGTFAGQALADHWAAITELHWARYRSGELTFQEQRRERVRDLLKRPMGSSEADALFDQYLAHYQDHWRLAPGASEFLARTAHVPKALVSNGEHKQVTRKASALGLLESTRSTIAPFLMSLRGLARQIATLHIGRHSLTQRVRRHSSLKKAATWLASPR
jgi:putative hydrolase of the HAD superfamily